MSKKSQSRKSVHPPRVPLFMRVTTGRYAPENLSLYLMKGEFRGIVLYKIGVSCEPESRRKTLQNMGFPCKASLLASLKAPVSWGGWNVWQIEDQLHKKYDSYRVKPNSEWFDLPEDAVRQLKAFFRIS